MSRAVKAMLRKELAGRLAGADSLVVVSLAGVDGVANNSLRGELRRKDIRVTVVKNSIAKQVLREVGLEPASELLLGPCALATGGGGVVPIVRKLLAVGRDIPAVQVRGALMEGEVFGPDRMVELSEYPTREEAVGRIVALTGSPGSRLVGAMLAPGGRIGGILKAIEERGGEAEAPPAEAGPEPAGGAGDEAPAVE